MRKLAVFMLASLILGCAKPPEAETPAPVTADSSAAAQPSGGSVAPIGSGALGGAAPVTGAENLGGGGFGVGSAAKDMARGAAGTAGAGSLGQESDE